MRNGKDGLVYFLQTDDGKYVKVGFTRSLKVRLNGLRVDAKRRYGCAGSFIASISGTPLLEHQFHEHLAPFRDSHEWYHNAPEVRRLAHNLPAAIRIVGGVPSAPYEEPPPRIPVAFPNNRELLSALDEFRWENRMTRTAAVDFLLRLALDSNSQVTL